MAGSVKVAMMGDIAPGTAKAVTVEGKKIALFNVNGAFYAIEDACPHRGGPLSEGNVENGAVFCPWHAASFNLETGEASGPPAPRGVTPYRVVMCGPEIHIEIP